MNSPVASSVITTRSDWQSVRIKHTKRMENYTKSSIVVKSPDTDVLVLLIHYFPQMTSTCEVWFQTGMVTSIKDCRCYIPVHELCKSLNSVVCNILPAAHAITGCDTTSSFFGIGKKSMLKALKETPDQFSNLSMISHADIDDSVDVCMIRREIQVPR